MILGHCDYERRIGPGNDLALKRIGDSNHCSNKERKSDQRSEGEPFHTSTLNAICISQMESSPIACSNARGLALSSGVENPDFCAELRCRHPVCPYGCRKSKEKKPGRKNPQ